MPTKLTGTKFTLSDDFAVTRSTISLASPVSVKSYGAKGDGVTDDTAAFASAAAQSGAIFVPPGTYLLNSAPTLPGVLVELDADAVLTGSGAVSIGATTGGNRQTVHMGTTGADYSTRFIRRNASHSGGTPGYVSGAFKAYTYVGANATNFEWAIVGVVDNSATAGENVGGYFQGIKRATGPTWGAVVEVIDKTGANPTTGVVALEVDVNGNGTDNNVARIGIDIAFRKLGADPAGADCVGSYGVRIQNGNETNAKVTTGYGFISGMKADVGFDTSNATMNQAAYKMAQGQVLAFNADASKVIYNDGNRLVYRVGGDVKSGLSDNGSIELNDTRFVINGTWDTGAQVPTIGTNKPGSTGGAPAQWLSVKIDGTQYWIPVWAN